MTEPILITLALLIVGYFWGPVGLWLLASRVAAQDNHGGAQTTEG